MRTKKKAFASVNLAMSAFERGDLLAGDFFKSGNSWFMVKTANMDGVSVSVVEQKRQHWWAQSVGKRKPFWRWFLS